MKNISKILSLCLLLGFTSTALAGANEIQILSDKTTEVTVALNSKSVKMSAAGYSMAYLKVLVPELAALTVLDHRNLGEDAPCVRLDDNQEASVSSILAAGEGNETIAIHVLTSVHKSQAGDVCLVEMIESVDTVIRGKTFVHQRSIALPTRNIEDCL